MDYFILRHDYELDGIWLLSDIVDGNGKHIVASNFTKGILLDVPNLGHFETEQLVVGKSVDYSETYLKVPIISKSLGEAIAGVERNAIQRIPLRIKLSGEQDICTDYEILNITSKQACIDTTRTIVERYTEQHGIPEKVGEINSLGNITIIPEKAQGHHIFRLSEWDMIIIVSSQLKTTIEKAGYTGFYFTPA